MASLRQAPQKSFIAMRVSYLFAQGISVRLAPFTNVLPLATKANQRVQSN